MSLIGTHFFTSRVASSFCWRGLDDDAREVDESSDVYREHRAFGGACGGGNDEIVCAAKAPSVSGVHE